MLGNMQAQLCCVFVLVTCTKPLVDFTYSFSSLSLSLFVSLPLTAGLTALVLKRNGAESAAAAACVPAKLDP